MNRLFVFIAASALLGTASNASLDDILAPLPEPEIVAVPVSVSHVEVAAPVEEVVYPITDEDVERILIDELTDLMRPSSELTLVPLRAYPDLSEHSKPFSIRVISAPNRLSRSNMLLRFKVENEKGFIGEYALPFQAHLYSDVYFIKTNIRAGEIASMSDLEVRRADLLSESSAIPAAAGVIERHEYSRNLTSGRILQWGDLEERSVVKKGEVVDVFGRSGLLAIATRAIARQDGAEGDYIVLRNVGSNQEFSALVVSENKVEVKF